MIQMRRPHLRMEANSVPVRLLTPLLRKAIQEALTRQVP